MTSTALPYYFIILVIIISSFPIVNTLQIPPKVMAQASAEGAKVLIDDVIQDLKSSATKKAQIHLDILNQQLPTFATSESPVR